MSLLAVKRHADLDLVPAKRTKLDVANFQEGNGAPPRSSSLLSPIMMLEGHQGEILCSKFNSKGDLIASAGSERYVFFWRTYGECENTVLQTPHKGTITDLTFSHDSSYLYTASVDKTVGVWDVETGARLKRLKGHTNFINAVGECKSGPPYVISGGDDSHARLWDIRQRGSVLNLGSDYAITAVSFGESMEKIITGSIDNEIKVWDLRNVDVEFKLTGHSDIITGLDLSFDGNFILSNSMDDSLRVWDIRPFAAADRCVKLFHGHSHGFEKYLLKCAWSKDGKRVCSGSSDRYVYVWDTQSRQIEYKLPGHKGTVTCCDFHPEEPILLSGSVDKTIFLGELEHKD